MNAEIVEQIFNPEFEKATKVHDWRNHVPRGIVQQWDKLCVEARICVIEVAQDAADREHWD